MADDRIVKVIIQSQFEGKGAVDAKKATEDLKKTVQKTNDSVVSGAKKSQMQEKRGPSVEIGKNSKLTNSKNLIVKMGSKTSRKVICHPPNGKCR